MKLPRAVSGERVIRLLEHLGYSQVRQKGSHVKLRHPGPPAHTITVPLHNPLKTGTLHGIIAEVAQIRSMSFEELVKLLEATTDSFSVAAPCS